MFYFNDFWELLFMLIVPFIIWLVVVPIYLLIKTNRLSRELKSLRNQLSTGATVSASLHSPVSDIRANFQQPSPIPPPVAYPMYGVITPSPNFSEPEPDSAFITWLKEDVLVKIGALLLLLALAWFVTYAFANNWIGPVGRITLGLMFGVGVLVFGSIRIRLYQSQGAIFTVLGSTVVILTVSAAQYNYNMFVPEVALGVMFLMVLYVAFVSLNYERVSLAYASLISALLAPFLINLNTYDSVWLMLYLLLVVVGTLGVVWFLRAAAITLVALIGVILYTPIAYSLDQGVALLFAFIFTGIFFITNIISLIRRYTEWVSPVHVTTALITGLYLITMTLAAAPEEWISTYLLVWAVIFAYGSFQVFLRTQNRIPFYIYVGVSLVLLGSATAIELSGPWLTIILTLEVLASIVLMRRLTDSQTALNLATGLLIIPGLYTLEHMSSYAWRDGFLHGDFLALLIFTGALVVAAIMRSESLANNAEGEAAQPALSRLFVVAGIYGLIIVWLFFHSIFQDFVGTLLSLVTYSVVGLTLFLKGRAEDQAAWRLAGILLLVFVVGRLLLIDVWALDLSGRIITFLVIGLLFISTAFLPKHRPENNNN